MLGPGPRPQGTRCSAAEAHLLPALGRPNLQLAMRQEVQRVELEAGRAAGVRLAGGALVRARE